MFPEGSYGNCSAMRVGPIGCLFYNDKDRVLKAAEISSITTYSHPQAVQGAALQAAAVAAVLKMDSPLNTEEFLHSLDEALDHFYHDTSLYREALQKIREGLASQRRPAEMADILGTGIEAREAVPMALYCFLASGRAFDKVIEDAVFLGGDADTIASMAGSLSGAFGGLNVIPRPWLARVREEHYTPARVKALAEALCDRAISG